MKSYLVTWRIDIEADSPEEAAREALMIQRDEEGEATYFEVMEKKNNKVTNVNLMG